MLHLLGFGVWGFFRISDFGLRISAAAVLFATTLFTTPAAAADADRQFTFAARLMQQQEYRLAEEAFGEFLKSSPDDRRVSDVRYYLALLARQRGDLKAAQQHLDAVTNPVQVTPQALHMIRGQVALESGDARAAVGSLEKINPDQLPDADARATWHYLMGTAYRGSGNLPGAAKHFDAAGEADSAVRGQALVELGKVRVAMKDLGPAVEALLDALKSNLPAERAAEARALAADIAYVQQRYPLAAELYGEVVSHHQATPQFKPALIGLLRALYASAQDEQLVKQYEATSRFMPDEHRPEALYLVGAAHVRRQQYDKGAATLLEFYRQFGSDHALAGEVAYLYAVCFYHTDLPGFEKWIASVEAQLPRMAHRHELMYLHAQAAVKREDYAAAIGRLAPLIAESDNPYARRALMQRAALHEKLSQSPQAAADYALYAQRYGQDPQAASASRRAIDLAFAAGEFQKVAQLAGDWLKQPNLDPTDRAGVRFKLAISQLKLNQADAALAEFDALLAGDPPADLGTLAHYYRGLILAARAKPAGAGELDTTRPAIDALEQAMRGSLAAEQRLQSMDLIAQLHRLAGRDDEALRTYEQLRQHKAPASFDPLLAVWIARGLHQQGRHDAVLAWTAAVIDSKTADPSAVAEAMYLAGRSQQAMGNHVAAIEMFQRLVAWSRGYGDQGRLGLAQSLAQAGKVEDALNEFDGLINAEASEIAASALLESALIQVDLARRFANAGDAAAADRLFTEARKRLSRVVILYDVPQLQAQVMRATLTLAELDAAAGDSNKARDQFKRITDRQPVTPWHDVAAAERLLLDGQRGEALLLLRKVVSAHGQAAAGRYAAERLARLGEQP